MILNKKPQVSIFILNYNNKKDTVECLESVQKIQYDSYEIYLVQNGSSQEVNDFFKEKYPKIHHVCIKENKGFTGGFNVGIKEILKKKPEYILFVSNDVVVSSNIVQKFLEEAQTVENAKIFCPAVFYYHNPTTLWCAGGDYNWILGKNKMRGTGKTIDEGYKKSCSVDWASFCIVLFKADVFSKIGYLDESFFLSNEDLDFCLRAKENKIITSYCSSAWAYHKVAVDLGGIHHPLYMYYQVRNTLLCHKKHLGKFHFFISFLNYLLISVPHRIVNLVSNKNGSNSKYIVYGIYDFLRSSFEKGLLSEKIKEELELSKKKFRVGINARYLQRQMTGIEKYTYELIKNVALNDPNTDYYIFFMKNIPVPDMDFPGNVKKINSRFSGKRVSIKLFWELVYLFFEIKKYKLDVFHGPAFFVPLLKPKRCKFITTVHDLAFLTSPKTFTFSTRLYFFLLFKVSLKLCDKIIAVSNVTKKDMIEHYSIHEEKVLVIHSGISAFYKPTSSEERKKKVLLKYNILEKYILFVGALSPRKNVVSILKAYKTYNTYLQKQQKKESITLVLVGKKAWLYDDIFSFIFENKMGKSVLFLDYVPENDLVVLYSNAELFLFPSLYEGFGFPVLEAMACGTPVITSNVSSLPEVAGNAAILVDPKNVEEITEAMIKITHNPKLKEEFIKKGKEQVKKFTWKESAQKTIEVYHELGKKN